MIERVNSTISCDSGLLAPAHRNNTALLETQSRAGSRSCQPAAWAELIPADGCTPAPQPFVL